MNKNAIAFKTKDLFFAKPPDLQDPILAKNLGKFWFWNSRNALGFTVLGIILVVATFAYGFGYALFPDTDRMPSLVLFIFWIASVSIAYSKVQREWRYWFLGLIKDYNLESVEIKENVISFSVSQQPNKTTQTRDYFGYSGVCKKGIAFCSPLIDHSANPIHRGGDFRGSLRRLLDLRRPELREWRRNKSGSENSSLHLKLQCGLSTRRSF